MIEYYLKTEEDRYTVGIRKVVTKETVIAVYKDYSHAMKFMTKLTNKKRLTVV
jgi:hypothetical protein